MFTQLTEFATNNALLVVAFFALIAIIIFNEVKNLGQKFTKLSPGAAVQLMNNNDDVVFLDVRESGETANGKITKSIQIPVGSVKERIAEIEKYKDKPVVVYCKTGTRSSIACNALTKNGFSNVYNLTGGIMSWQEAHMPIGKK
ncbi:MAG: rhodanese-related sulfurtransferase [Candidatus Azotimanducaceae bacterium]|jgi:rhodanese-related sulfurtransferase